MPIEDALLALERDLWLVEDRVPLYRTHLADDAVLVFHSGVMDREQTLASVGEAPAWTEVDFSDTRVTEPADGVALVVYRAAGRRAGGDVYAAYCSSLYVRGDDGRWRLALHQQSPAPDAG